MIERFARECRGTRFTRAVAGLDARQLKRGCPPPRRNEVPRGAEVAQLAACVKLPGPNVVIPDNAIAAKIRAAGAAVAIPAFIGAASHGCLRPMRCTSA